MAAAANYTHSRVESIIVIANLTHFPASTKTMLNSLIAS